VDSSCTHNSQKRKIIQIYKYKRIEKQTMAPSYNVIQAGTNSTC
jgi:hypothetical protein